VLARAVHTSNRPAIPLHEDFDGICRPGNFPISIGTRWWTAATTPFLFPVADEDSVAGLDVTSFGNQSGEGRLCASEAS
jgi:hypothetical protein